MTLASLKYWEIKMQHGIVKGIIILFEQVALHVAFVHSFVNPLLFLVLHKGCRKATLDLLCCNFSPPQGK